MRTLLLALLVAQAPPSQEEIDRALKTFREFTKSYVERLPDFVCRRTTQHSIQKAGETDWTPQMKVVEETTYRKREEHYQVVEVDGKPAKKIPAVKGYMVYSSGDFGGFLGALAQPETKAEFTWKGMETVGGRVALVFRYRTPGGYEITDCNKVFGISKCSSHQYARQGEIRLAEDGTLLRITIEPVNLPGYEEKRTVDYAVVTIGGADYILPATDVFERIMPKVHVKNESAYTDYQKFSAESTLKPSQIF